MIPEVSRATSRCPNPELWSCYDDLATEVEVLDMLTALVWMLKPAVIVETGCYNGFGTERMLRGVIKNRFGHIHTCDMDHSRTLKTIDRVSWAADKVTVKQCSGVELISSLPTIDFAFLDSGGVPARGEELDVLVPRLSPWGVIAVHDTGETHPDIREDIQTVAARHGLDGAYFDTPRGFAILKKRV